MGLGMNEEALEAAKKANELDFTNLEAYLVLSQAYIANEDFDRDGFSNVQEYLLGSDPTNSASNLRVTSFETTNIQWQTKGYEVYELYSSTNLADWTRAVNPIVPTNSVGTAASFTNGGPRQMFRVQKVP